MERLGLAAIGKAHPATVAFVLALVINVIAVVVIAVELVIKDKAAIAAGLVVAVAAINYFTLRLLPSVIAQSQSSELPAKAKDVTQQKLSHQWLRPMLQHPWRLDDLDSLVAVLTKIRSDAATFLKKQSGLGNLSLEDIRVNIFLADYSANPDGDVCTLKIVPGLCVGAFTPDENRLSLRVGQGVSGRAYARGKLPLMAQISNAEPVATGDYYALTSEQRKAIHTELKWILSIPIVIPFRKTRKPIGVLNVDGLRLDVDLEQINTLAGYVLQDVLNVAEVIAKQPLVGASIHISEREDA